MTTLPQIYDQRVADGLIKPDAAQRAVLERLEELRRQFENPPPRGGVWPFKKQPPAPKGFYLHGGVGRGKSMLMDLFFNAVNIRKKRRVHFHAFMLEVHDELHYRRVMQRGGMDERIDDDLLAVAARVAVEARLLCFDEFQVKDVADAMIIGRLFTALFKAGVVTVMTSNTAPDNLYLDGLQRDRFLPFIDLLKEKMDVLEFTGATDYRLGKLRDLKVYFWPNDADARAELKKNFLTLSDGEPAAPMSITVKSRVIDVPRAAKGVCAFTFAELCEQAKSALDYLELSKVFHAFIVEDIPKLDDQRRDAVLRFVTLVDTLYDGHALLAVSAALPPDKLYAGTEHAGVFARTVSRLMEMQSRAYRDTGRTAR